MARENELTVAPRNSRWHWRDSQEEIQARFPREQPVQPEVGAGWFDEAHGCFCVWNGRHWVGIPVD